MNFWLILAIYGVFLAVYWFFVLAILWHVKEFSTKKDLSYLSVKVFLSITIILTVISAVLFFNLPVLI
ncbi:hypothetical protein HYT01_01775 [Candidatus Giovannonibacteria bacterium]|nr:hypothetical protein [Candidatus Giovannonibacteria bacterium]